MRPIDKRKRTERQKLKQASWLDRIQQDSWQLELVISGIAILLLLQVLPYLLARVEQQTVLMFSGETIDQVLVFPFSLLVLGTYGLVTILCFHLILRGLWIGAIGLRSVSGGFDFEAFGLSDIISTYDPMASTDSLLLAHSSLHRVFLGDSLLQDVPWRLYHHPVRQQDGWLFALPVYNLERGEHCLRFDELRAMGGYLSDLNWETQATICFMK